MTEPNRERLPFPGHEAGDKGTVTRHAWVGGPDRPSKVRGGSWPWRWIAPGTTRLALALALVAVLPQPGQADELVRDVNRLTQEAIRYANTPPPAAARYLALVHVAGFEAVNALQPRWLAYRTPWQAPPAGASPEAAFAGAANQVLRLSWPQFTPTLDARLEAQLRPLPEGPARTAGLAWGRQVAQALLLERDFDGANVGVDYQPSAGPGRWQPTPVLFASALLPQWPGVIPFALPTADLFRPPPPPALSSDTWVAEFEEVRQLGARNSTRRTAEQTQIAWFWADGVGTQTPPGRWNDVAGQLDLARGWSLGESARMYALLNLALADAGIACWDAKYAHEWWRPVTAIRLADTDGNPATVADPGWTPLVVTPPFPEHVSGHSTFSAAAAAVLAACHGSDAFEFSLDSDGLLGIRRSYRSFSEAALEAGMSRIYGGIHFASANREGQRLGRRVGEYVSANFLLPREVARVTVESAAGGVRVRWPAGATLESCDSLGTGDWVPVKGTGELLIPMGSGTRFYRLHDGVIAVVGR